jgi:hypothetical protein
MCFVMCECVYVCVLFVLFTVWVCVCGFCNVWLCFVCVFNVWVCVYVGFLICGCVYVFVL